MTPKRPSLPIEMQAFRRRPRRWLRLLWALAAGLTAALLIWFMFSSSGEPGPQPSREVDATEVAARPWRLGSPEARFTIVFYADLECPYCKAYSPQLQQWIDAHQDVNLQWHHVPMSIHEPAASQEARLVECAGQAGGHEAFWAAVQWVYANTRSDGQGVPDLEMFPGMSADLKACLSGEPSARIVHAQAAEAAASGITATPSLRLIDRTSGRSIVLPGPVPGDALLSAIDMLAANDLAETKPSDGAGTPASGAGDVPR
ncbi:MULTISPECIES: DsbA family protein [Comamonadaceae]|uniref:DsbA family protein n=1 Tax=Comamonadaceae TaxID=80864 RepID=UPI00056FB225|nr:DsbA family protein [Xenophilus azovorans]MBI2748000.1 thioredoxin domain-containing protein [Burkholderiales bacterium]